jgi:arylformamidase
MLRIIDLSYCLDDKPSIPGHPSLETIPITTHEKHGRSNTGMRVSAHLGTHVDSPYHFVQDGQSIDQIPLDKVVGPCVKIDLRNKLKPKGGITAAMLDDALRSYAPDITFHDKILMVYTGWMNACGGYHNAAFYRDNWTLTVPATDLIIEKGFKAVAVDFPVDEALPGGPRPGDAPAHRNLLGHGIPLVENLVNMDQVRDKVFFFVGAPINLAGFDGAPARAFAIEGLVFENRHIPPTHYRE